MKTLFLLRHAKSSWDDPTALDHDRPLAPRGERAAGRIALHMKSTGMSPDLVLCSSALRARDTLDRLGPALDGHIERSIEDELYGADADELLTRLRKIPPSTGSAMVIGHNPGLHDLAADLIGDGDERAVAQLRIKFPTAALAVLQLGTAKWNELDFGQAYLSNLVLPRELR
jgi:phosphohistidine phosphatase